VSGDVLAIQGGNVKEKQRQKHADNLRWVAVLNDGELSRDEQAAALGVSRQRLHVKGKWLASKGYVLTTRTAGDRAFVMPQGGNDAS